MTFATGSATDLEDLLSKLDTFADTTHAGWTGDYTTNPQTTDGWFSLSKGNLNVSMKYPVGAQGPPEHMSIHQATAFVGQSTAPGAHTADSGNGYNTGTTGHTNGNLLAERCVSQIGNGPFPAYYFFADDTAPNDYIHVVVETLPGVFRHFGFGELVKFGDGWTGGEYVYGCFIDQATNATATDTNHQCLLDSRATTAGRLRAATVRIASGLANQGTAVWGVSAELATGNLLLDTATNPRRQIHGGFRGGLAARGFGTPVGNSSSGAVPLYAIEAYYRDPSNARVYKLGEMPDVAALNIRNFEPGSTLTIGTDTWYVFPLSQKTTAAVAGRSLYSGIAYREESP